MSSPPVVRNRLLAALTPNERSELMPLLDRVDLTWKQALIEPNTPIHAVYFVESALVSITAERQDGGTIEIATVGYEGFIGLPVFLSSSSTPLRAFVQAPGSAYRMHSDALVERTAHGGELRRTLNRYTESLFFQTAQLSACNRLHSVEQRAARWIAMTDDRMGQDEFPLTQEFLGEMLGVQRPTVSALAADFKRRQLIAYRRGRMSVLDRDGLYRVACDCLTLIDAHYERLLAEA